MKKLRLRDSLGLSLALLLVAAQSLSAAPPVAAAPSSRASDGIGVAQGSVVNVTGVEPSIMLSTSGGTLSVYGTGFNATSVVRIVGYGLLPTTFVNATALTAQVPAGAPAGTHDIEVTDGGKMAHLTQAITLVAPTPIPAPTAPPTPKPTPPPGRPILTIRNYKVEPPQVRAGTEFTVHIEIYNNGSRAGENTMAVFPGGMFVPVGEPGHMIWQLHINHTAVVSQKLRAPAELSSGVHQMQVNLSANDWAGDHYEYPQTVPVEVIGKPVYTGRPEVTVEGAHTSPSILTPGAPFTLTLRLANRGSRTAINVLARCTSEDLVIPAAASDTVSTAKIGIEETVTVTLPLHLHDTASGGRKPLALALTFSDYEGSAYAAQQNVGIDVNDSLRGQPQLLIEQYHTTPDFVSPGDSLTLTLRITNVGGAAAKRVILALGGENGAALEPFSPLGNSNVIFLPEVPCGESVTAEQALMVDGAAGAKVYNLPVALAYDDARQQGASARRNDTQRLCLIVRRRPEVQAIFYRDPEGLAVGTATPVSLEVRNVGTSSLRILGLAAKSVQLDISAEGTPFLGPLDPGGSAPLDVTVTPRESGPAEIVVRVAYRDDLNQIQALTRTLSLEVPANPALANVPAPGLAATPVPEADAQPRLLLRLGRALQGFLGFGS